MHFFLLVVEICARSSKATIKADIILQSRASRHPISVSVILIRFCLVLAVTCGMLLDLAKFVTLEGPAFSLNFVTNFHIGLP